MKKIIIFFLFATLFLVGCENSATKDMDQPQSSAQQTKQSDPSNGDSSNRDKEEYVTTAKSKNGQVFRVISAYKWVNQYVEKAKDTNSESKRFELWQNIVMDHVQEQCLSGDYSGSVYDYIYFPPKDLESLKSTIKILRASNIENTTIQALKASAKIFPGPDTTVCLFPQGSMDRVGLALDAGKISIFYYPSLGKYLFKSLVAHEYHHSTWIARYLEKYNKDSDLLSEIIIEGKAEYFASLLYGPSTTIFSHMSGKEEERLWNKVKDSLHTTDGDKIDTVLYGGKKGFPVNFGYAVGYHIVRHYVENHPNVSIEEWSKLSPEELYKRSGYEDSARTVKVYAERASDARL